MTLKLNSQYTDLGHQFSRRNLPAKTTKPVTLLWNSELATQLSIELPETSKAAYFSGTKLFEGSKPTSMVYAGHQFGHFNPQLGDGRAHLLGELIDQKGTVHELHLKGSGATPYSRNGDGKCGIKPAVREFIMSEALYAMGVPTTRSLSVVATGEPLMRQDLTTGAVVTRVAQSHTRVGTFEYFAARGMHAEIEVLTDLCINRHFNNIDKNSPSKYINLLSEVIDKNVKLTTEWMRIGFIHGVLNTDNTLLSGETIDFGPCAMMGAYNPSTVFSSIDHKGRYAYGNQSSIIQWNMARLAECLIPLIDKNEKKAIDTVMPLLVNFEKKYQDSYHQMMSKKLGFDKSQQLPEALLNDLLESMFNNQLDYTLTFVSLMDSLGDGNLAPPQLKLWHENWLNGLAACEITTEMAQKTMIHSNPIVIPRNHHIETVLKTTEESLNDLAAKEYIKVLKSPYLSIKDTSKYQTIDAKSDLTYETYCGT